MKRLLIAGILSFIILPCIFSKCFAETVCIVYLRNSETVKGSIIELIPEESLKIRAIGNKLYEFPFDIIDRIKVLESSAQKKSETIDAIYLEDNRTINGDIIEIITDKSVKIRTVDDNLYEYPFDSIVKIIAVETPQELGEEEYRAPRKSPALALTLALFLPTAGQFYNGQTEKGIICATIMGAGGLVFIIGLDREFGEEEDGENLIGGGLLVIYSTWFYTIADAYFSAKSINKKRNYSLYEFSLKNNIALSFTPTMNDEMEFKPGLKLTYRF